MMNMFSETSHCSCENGQILPSNGEICAIIIYSRVFQQMDLSSDKLAVVTQDSDKKGGLFEHLAIK